MTVPTDPFRSVNTNKKISAVRFVDKPVFGRGLQIEFISGSWDDEDENTIALWTCQTPQYSDHDVQPGYNNIQNPTFEVSPVVSAKHSGDVTSIQVLDQENVVTTSGNGSVYVYKLDTNSANPTLNLAHQQQIHRFQSDSGKTISPATATSSSLQRNTTNKAIATVGSDGKLNLVKLGSDGSVYVETAKFIDPYGLNDVCWRSSETLITSSNGLKVFDTRDTRKPVLRLSRDTRKSEVTTCVAVNPSQINKVAAGTDSRQVIFWDIRNPDAIWSDVKEMHSSEVWDVLYHPSSDKLFTGGEDGIVGVYDGFTQTSKSQYNFFSRSGVNSLDYHEESRVLLCGTDDYSILLKNE
ncbi:WD40-repeat-containing domain protein [Paraphysoderma sedebokerense]|nr:WD40-repeat-containing domain protein [Paraphysoderma sedebokerense]